MTLQFRRIFPLGPCVAALVIIAIAGCPGSTAPVDTSQRILVEVAEGLSLVDGMVTEQIDEQGDAAIDRAQDQMMRIGCGIEEDRADCVVRYLRREMDQYYELVRVLTMGWQLLSAWEQLNDRWRETGDRPIDWGDEVCDPIGELVRVITMHLNGLNIDAPAAFTVLAPRVEILCELGVAVADMTGEGGRE